MNYDEARDLTDKLTPINNVKLSLRAAELVYPIYKKYDEDDTVVIGAINAVRNYIENPCEETVEAVCAANAAVWSAANAANAATDAARAAWSATDATYAADFAAYSAHSAASATRAAAHAAFAADFASDAFYAAEAAAWSAVNATADDTIEVKIREYASKLIKEQKGGEEDVSEK